MYFNAERAVEAAAKGQKVLLVRTETSPEDLRGMIAAEGILTAKGGVSSHAALVARQMGKVCVCGASALQIDYSAKSLTVNGKVFAEVYVGEHFENDINAASVCEREQILQVVGRPVVEDVVGALFCDDFLAVVRGIRKHRAHEGDGLRSWG